MDSSCTAVQSLSWGLAQERGAQPHTQCTQASHVGASQGRAVTKTCYPEQAAVVHFPAPAQRTALVGLQEGMGPRPLHELAASG